MEVDVDTYGSADGGQGAATSTAYSALVNEPRGGGFCRDIFATPSFILRSLGSISGELPICWGISPLENNILTESNP